jgi:hypothetical protein
MPEPFSIPAPVIGEPGDEGGLFVLEMAGIFADLDGDDRPEVVISHMLTDGMAHDDRVPTVYHYDGANMQLVGPLGSEGLVKGGWFMPRALLDLDGDGHIDALTSTKVAWGTGNGEFGQAQFLTSLEDDRGSVDGLALADIDGDGWIDVLIGGGHCRDGEPPLFPLLRTGPRTFAERLDIIQQSNRGRSFAVTAFPLEGGSVLGTLFSTCNDGTPNPIPFYQGTRQDFAPFQLLPPEYIMTKPMGASMGDLDGDGVLDLSITDHHDYFSGATLPMTDMTMTTGFRNLPAESNVPMIPWGIAFLDLDRDTRPDVVTVHGNDASSWSDPQFFIGPQWATIHRNLGGFHFQQMEAGVGRKGQWRALAVDDLDRDGDPDLIVCGQGEMPRIYRNDIEGGHGFSLRLRGSTSNVLGMGATVDVWPTEDAPMQRFLAGSFWSPAIVSQPLVFVGLGEATSAARVRITWPSGTVQEVTGLAAGTMHTIEEPPVITLDSTTRHAPADGASVITVNVTPRNPDGSVRADASVTVEVLGDGTAGPVTKVGEAWTSTITAPVAAGTATVRVVVDGVAVSVLPKLFWD